MKKIVQALRTFLARHGPNPRVTARRRLSSKAIPHRDWFAEMDAIDWRSMKHAYGSAYDVPGFIRRLTSTADSVREEAFFLLECSIFHQGKRYQATAPAVPFLLRVLEESDDPDSARLLELLAYLVMGYSESHLPHGFAKELRDLRARLATLRERDEADRHKDPRDKIYGGTDEDWLNWILNITDEAKKGIPIYLERLRDDAANEVRHAAIYMLSWLPEHSEQFADALWSIASDTGAHAPTRANALIALALSCDEERFRSFEEETGTWQTPDTPAELRLAAAIAIGTRAEATDTTNQILIDAISWPEDQSGWMNDWFDGVECSYACAVLRHTMADDPTPLVRQLATVLPQLSAFAAMHSTEEVLRLLFPNGFLGDSADDLTPLQREFCEALARLDGLLGSGSFANWSLMLRGFGLPESQAAFREFFGERPLGSAE